MGLETQARMENLKRTFLHVHKIHTRGLCDALTMSQKDPDSKAASAMDPVSEP